MKSLTLIGHAEKKMFKYYDNKHVYSPRAGADNPLGTKCFHEHKSSVHLHTPSKLPQIVYILLIFPHSNALVIKVDFAVKQVKVIPGS